MKYFSIFILAFSVPFMSLSAQDPATVDLINPSFEQSPASLLTTISDWSKIDGWNTNGDNSGVGNSEYYSPVDGEWYAFQKGTGDYVYQQTDHVITAGSTYKLHLWARGMAKVGNTSTAKTEARLYTGSTTLASTVEVVSPAKLKGEPRKYGNDDGGNVWLDNGYRHEFAERHFYQDINADPINDPWLDSESDRDGYRNLRAWAVGPVIVPGHKWVYGVRYRDRKPDVWSEIRFIEALSGGDPAYTWAENFVSVLRHDGDEEPWVIDPHEYYDEDTGRLWMSWGGGSLWVSELDPNDGLLIQHPEDIEFDAHPEYHTEIAKWTGDEWSTYWFEGPAIYKHNNYWYMLASYGDLGRNYTIRGGRGTSPTGPFYDMDGVALTEWDDTESEYGNTFFLGAEGGQNNPGHPHIWEEDGLFYMGFDYTDEYDNSARDRFGMRRLYWVNDWPVVAFTPIVATFNADDHPASIGQKLAVAFRSVGDDNSSIAVDAITVTVTKN